MPTEAQERMRARGVNPSCSPHGGGTNQGAAGAVDDSAGISRRVDMFDFFNLRKFQNGLLVESHFSQARKNRRQLAQMIPLVVPGRMASSRSISGIPISSTTGTTERSK